jgi:PTH1 family peptidyl-tRNA hydrolase
VSIRRSPAFIDPSISKGAAGAGRLSDWCRSVVPARRDRARPGTILPRPSRRLPKATLRVAAGRDSGHIVLSAEGSLKVVVGLGNPGSQYAGTRHNIGWLVMDRLAERAGWDGRGRRRDNSNVVGGRYRGLDLTLVKPLTYMNESGHAVRKVLQREHAPLGDILIVADDFALPFGKLRFREAGSHGGHNGLRSIIDELGTEKFSRLRVGIGDPVRDGRDHVLSKFAPDEVQRLDELLDAAADAVEGWARDGTSKASNRFNTFQLREADADRLAAPGEVDGPPDETGIRRTKTGWRRVLQRRDKTADA